MKEFKYTVTDELGIHARPAGLLAKKAAGFESKVTIAAGDKEVDSKRVLGVMGLGAKKGMEVVIKADGADEDAAIEALNSFMKENL
jgi:phosphocarrier protein